MEFCPGCKSILLPESRNGKAVLACSKCGYTREAEMKATKTFDKPEQSVYVVEKQEESRPRPKQEYWSA